MFQNKFETFRSHYIFYGFSPRRWMRQLNLWHSYNVKTYVETISVLELWEWTYSLTSLLALVDSILYSPDYPIYCKDGISSSFSLGLIFTSLIGCYKHHLFLSVALRLNYLFFLFGNEKTPGISLILVIGVSILWPVYSLFGHILL